MLRAIFLFLISLLFILLLGVPLLIYAAITRNTDPLYHVGVYCAGLLLRLGGIRTEVRGRERIPAGRAVVFMANHQSNVDPPAIFACLPPVLVIAKKESFRIPVLGPAMRMRGFIPIDRKDRERAIEAVQKAALALRAGSSFLVFPEGTRSPDGRLQPFKKGAFILALEASVPIVPVSLSGACRIMRKGDLAIHAGTMRITFHNPIPTEDRRIGNGLMDEVRRAILQGLAEDEWPIEELSARPQT
jgi:1-acyl-sn-glycerol-3-phosphate acyltransferase